MQQSLATQVQEIRGDAPMKQVQISRKVRAAVGHMVWDGKTRAEAAELAGITDDGLRKALKLPKVKALMAQELKELRESGPARAYINIMQLADAAKSEDVRLRSNQWIAGVDGLAPANKVQISGRVTHGFENYAYQGGATIDGTAYDGGDTEGD